jgi:hypothetical protein
MNEDHIRRFNEARTFLYLAGYVTDTENENIKQRFMKVAAKKGVTLVSRPLLSQLDTREELLLDGK